MEKVELIKQYVELKKQLGHQPSKVEFCKSTNISERTIGKQFGANSWNKFVEECGDTPKVFSKDKFNFEEILIQYGNLYRELQRHPPAFEWDFRKYTPTTSGVIVPNGIKWSDMPNKFLDFAYGKAGWQDVIDLIPNKSLKTKVEPNVHNDKLSVQINSFIPPIIQDLIDLSYDDSKSLEFEKKVNTCFEMLGFEVKQLGQGTGRKPDGIAFHKSNPRFAILIDSKSRSDGYKFGTDDRTFVEYIKTYADRLKNDGFDKLYFLVISSKFTSIPDTSVKRLALETHVHITFLSSILLLNILANKIEKPRLFNLNLFRELLIESGEINQVKIDIFFRNLIKSQSV